MQKSEPQNQDPRLQPFTVVGMGYVEHVEAKDPIGAVQAAVRVDFDNRYYLPVYAVFAGHWTDLSPWPEGSVPVIHLDPNLEPLEVPI